MKITYHGLEDIGISLAEAYVLLFAVNSRPPLPSVQCILGLFSHRSH
jgi:hypothetical protein